MRYLYDCDTWKWGILPKIPWFKASFSLYIGIAIWWLHIIFRHPYISIYIFWYSMIQPSKLLGIPTLDPFPITWKWRHSRQWSLGFIWPRPDQSKMRLEGNQCSALRRWIFGLICWRTFASWKFAMGMDLVQGKSTGTRHRLDLVSTSHTFVLIFPKTHWNENCLTSGSGYSSNEPGAPSTLRRQWKWQPVLQGLRPSKAWKGNLSPKKTFFPLQKQTILLSHPRIWGAGSFCLFLWAQSVGMSSAGGLFDLFAVCEPVSHGSHTHAYPRIGHPTQTALFQEWPIFVWRTASKFWKDLD